MSRAILKWLRPGRIYPHGDFQRVEFAETHELGISVLSFFLKWTTYPITSSPHAPPASYSYRLQRSNQQPTLAHLGTCLASNQTYSARTAFSKPGERSHEIPQSGLMAETGWSHSGKIIFPKYSKVKPPFADPHNDVLHLQRKFVPKSLVPG